MNGVQLLDGFASFPLKGAWSAALHVSTPIAPSTPTQIIDDQGGLLQLNGTCKLSSEDGPEFRAVIIGGAGKLGAPVNPAWHQSEPLSAIFSAHTSGEAFAASPSLSNQQNSYVASAWIFSDLLDELAPSWWMNDAGLVVVDPPIPSFVSVSPSDLLKLAPHGADFKDTQIMLRPGAVFPVFVAATSQQRQFQIVNVRIEWMRSGQTRVRTEINPWT